MKKITKYLCLTLLIPIVFSCTDLEIEGTDSKITDGFDGVSDIQGEINNISNIIAGDNLGNQNGLYALNEVSSDEYVVATRGTDWGDNGRWLAIHRHSWNADLIDVVQTWQLLNSITVNATRVINEKSVNTSGDVAVAELKAQASFYRAWAMHWVLDMYRQVPFRDVDLPNSAIPEVLTGQAAIDFIASDLEDAIAGLPEVTAGDAISLKSSPTKAAANLLLAKLHLNKHIYLNTTTEDTDMQAVIDAVDEITADGYSLAGSGDFFDIFRPSNDVETIWWSPSAAGSRIWSTLHYNLNFPGDNDGGGWNGFTTLSEFYQLFEGNPDTNYMGDGQEERRGWVPDATTTNTDNLGIGYGFLIGQQYGLTEKGGNGADSEDLIPIALNARDNVGGVPLVFTKEATKAEYTAPADNAILETDGTRMLKYHPNEEGGSQRPHIVKYRYADAYLMKAEAMYRMGGDPTAMINTLRTTRGASMLGTVGEEELLAERGRELYQELVRRQDLIRFGEFSRAWNLKEESDANREVFPIPISDILANPNLVQNPGY